MNTTKTILKQIREHKYVPRETMGDCPGLGVSNTELAQVTAQRDELLECLRDVLELGVGDWDGEMPSFIQRAQAAISKAEGSK